MVYMPPVLARAVERDLCRYSHVPIEMTVPAGAKIRTTFGPPDDVAVWRTFRLVFGERVPAGLSDKFIITHEHKGMVVHEDPWIHSVVSQSYPHNLVLRHTEPEILIIENKEAVDQTFDINIHYCEFETENDWNKYRAMVEESYVLLENVRGILEEVRLIREGVVRPPPRVDPNRRFGRWRRWHR